MDSVQHTYGRTLSHLSSFLSPSSTPREGVMSTRVCCRWMPVHGTGVVKPACFPLGAYFARFLWCTPVRNRELASRVFATLTAELCETIARKGTDVPPSFQKYISAITTSITPQQWCSTIRRLYWTAGNLCTILPCPLSFLSPCSDSLSLSFLCARRRVQLPSILSFSVPSASLRHGTTRVRAFIHTHFHVARSVLLHPVQLTVSPLRDTSRDHASRVIR